VGTALGGVCTLVGEPQNLLIATVAGWDFQTFFMYMAPITMPVLACGLITCVLLEATGLFGYGAPMPDKVREVLVDFDAAQQASATQRSQGKIMGAGGGGHHSGIRFGIPSGRCGLDWPTGYRAAYRF
jgi:NhaB family Na+:H+ antiporter